MDTLKLTARLSMLLCACLLTAVRLTAQAPADLFLFEPIESTIDGEPETWSFNVNTGEAVSLRVEATSGDLDPVLTVRDKNGAVLLTNDDFNYPDSRDALLEAITIPEFGLYTVTVSGFGDTSGDYRLTFLPGYADLIATETFESLDGWEANDAVAVQAADEQLQLTLTTPNATGLVINQQDTSRAVAYTQVDVSGIVGSNWAVGMAARVQDDGSHYLFLVNEQGEWRASLQTPDGEQVIRDWTRHPSIRASERQFSLAVLTNGAGLEFSYNRSVVGRIDDTILEDAGHIGLAIDNVLNIGEVSAMFDNLATTVPVELDGQRVVPQTLVLNAANAMTLDLQRRGMIPPEGELVLNLGESFTEHGRPGVNVLPLASGIQFSNLAIGTTVYADGVAEPPSGCGLILRQQDATTYTLAYVDSRGGYGISQRSGDTFSEGLYGETANWNPSEGHHLLVIADTNTLHYYVDGRYVGMTETEAADGGIGNAVVNFEPVYTSCRFVNTWVWRWS